MSQINLQRLCTIVTWKLDVNAHNPNGLYPFFTCARESYNIDVFAFEWESVLVAWNGDLNVKYYNWKFNAYQRTYVLQDFVYNGKYLYYAISRNLEQLRSWSRGSTIKYIRLWDLENIPIPLVSLPHQTLIVDEIEKQLSRLESGLASLHKLQTLVKQYRASVLSSAVSGKLVPQDPSDEHASLLLERILEAKKEKRLAENSGKKYKGPSPIDTSELGDLPDGWCWTTFWVACDVYVWSTPSRSVWDYRWWSISWVSSWEVHFQDIYSTKETITELWLNNSSTTIHPIGTVLVWMIGEWKTRWQVARLKIAACHNQNTAAIRMNQEFISSDYIYYYLSGKYESLRSVWWWWNQKALNKWIIESISFPLPPLNEQHHIVAEVERRLSVVEQLEQMIKDNIIRANHLKQSLLHKAFSGKLIDYEDDPADIELLLTQIDQAKQTALIKLQKRK